MNTNQPTATATPTQVWESALAAFMAQPEDRMWGEAAAEVIAGTLEPLRAKIANQAERIRYLEGATNHATGTPLSHARSRVDTLERELSSAQAALAEAKAEVARLKERERLVLAPSYVEPLADGDCLVMTERVKEYVIQLRARVAELQEQASFSEERRIKLAGQVAELEADKARVDWLEAYGQHINGVWNFPGLSCALVSARAAIDAARKGKE